MFTSEKSNAVINSVRVGEGSFQIPAGNSPEMTLVMVYSNKDTGATFGTCPVRASRLSSSTMQLFRQFLDSAEMDFGTLILEGGFIEEAGGAAPSLGQAESERGLQRRGLGGT